MAENSPSSETVELENLNEVTSNEVYDKLCQICDYEREAVGFCSSCDMYVCVSCGNHHKKIPSLRNHVIHDKDSLGHVKAKRGLFERMVIPVAKAKCQSSSYYVSGRKLESEFSEFRILQVLSVPNTEDTIYMIYQFSPDETALELAVIDEINGYRWIKSMSSKSLTLNGCDTSCQEIYLYFILPKPSVVLKYCHKHGYLWKAFQLPVGGVGFGIAPFNKGLAISINFEMGYNIPDWQIRHLDYKGHVLDEFCYDDAGKPLFKAPKYLAANEAQDILYISDYLDHTIITMDTTGAILSKYSYPSIRYPLSITTDEENNMYLACLNNVVQIDKQWKNTRTLLQKEGDFDVNDVVSFICYNKTSKRLSVVDCTKQIIVFKFLP